LDKHENFQKEFCAQTSPIFFQETFTSFSLDQESVIGKNIHLKQPGCWNSMPNKAELFCDWLEIHAKQS
jgi:hypothetical protein